MKTKELFRVLLYITVTVVVVISVLQENWLRGIMFILMGKFWLEDN